MLVNVNNANYHVNIVGEGEPLLLLHGFTGSLKTWEPFIQVWSPFFTLIMVDLLGHGNTDSPLDFRRYHIEQVAFDLKELLNSLGITKTHLLGYSMGGRVALTFSVLYPEHVLSLTLESSSPGLKSAEERVLRKNNDNLLADRIENEGIEAFVAYWEDIPLFKTQEKKLSASQKQIIRTSRLQNSSVGLANSLRGMGTGIQPSWWGELGNLAMPVLLMVGEADQKFCTINNEMCVLIPNAEFLLVPDAGHAIHVEQPDFFGKIIKDYLMKKDDH